MLFKMIGIIREYVRNQLNEMDKVEKEAKQLHLF